MIVVDGFRIKLADSKCHATGRLRLHDHDRQRCRPDAPDATAHTLNVASTGNFTATGTFTVAGVIGTCNYTAKTATSFTGVTGCNGTPANGALVTGPEPGASP